MDKVAFYEEVILGEILEKEAATKFKEMLAGGNLSGKTQKILEFNKNRGAFDAPVQRLGSRMSSFNNERPTRNILGTKIKDKLGIQDKGSKIMSNAFTKQINMENKGLNTISKYHGEKNTTPLFGFGSRHDGTIKYR